MRQVYYEWSRPWVIYELVMKKSAKELDPRHFNPLERRQFDISDQGSGRNGSRVVRTRCIRCIFCAQGPWVKAVVVSNVIA